MGAFLTYGVVLAISIVIGLIFTIIGLFVGNIILFDSIFFAAISGIICNQIWSVHPAICIVIALVLFGLLFRLQKTKAGFWIIGVLLSAFWALVFSFLAYVLSSSDKIWAYVVLGLGFIAMIGLHLRVRE